MQNKEEANIISISMLFRRKQHRNFARKGNGGKWGLVGGVSRQRRLYLRNYDDDVCCCVYVNF